MVVESGISRNHRNFQTIRLHTRSATRMTAEILGNAEGESEELVAKPVYEELL